MRNEFRIADIALAPEGHRRMEWAWEYMPVLKLIAEKEAANQPLAAPAFNWKPRRPAC